MDDNKKPFMTNKSLTNGSDVLAGGNASSDLEYCPKCGQKTLKKIPSRGKSEEESSAYECQNPDCKKKFEIVDFRDL